MEKRTRGRRITFKWFSENGSIDLGVPHHISAKPETYDFGCFLDFSTAESSIGLNERFTLILNSSHIRLITKEMWNAFMKISPDAHKELQGIVRELRSSAKKK